MSAVIMKEGRVFSDFNHMSTGEFFSSYIAPLDYLTYVMSRSHPSINNDGYGVVAYKQDLAMISESFQWYKRVLSTQGVNQVYYTGNLFNHNNAQDVFDIAIDRLQLRDARANIILCHARNATANPFAPGNHPFIMNHNNTTYSLMHNGFVSMETRRFMINEIVSMDEQWFNNHQPNYSDYSGSDNPETWVDSEVLFQYIMCHIDNNNSDVYKSLRLSLKKIEPFMELPTNVVNFVLSDGQHLYAFRSSPLIGANSVYRLSFKDSPDGFYAVRSGVPTLSETQINQNELIIVSQDDKLQRYPQFLSDEALTAYRQGHNLNNNHRIQGTPIINNDSGIRISFNLISPARVKLNVYNIKGQLVNNLADKTYLAGSHVVVWNGQNDNGKKVQQGVYFIETVNGNSRSVNKVFYFR